MTSLGLIVNPHARRNRRDPARVERLRRLLGEHGVLWQTRSLDDLRTAIAQLVAQGVLCIAADGGDGSLNWVINETMLAVRRQGAARVPLFVPTRAGTVDFVANKAGIRGSAETILPVLIEHLRRGEEIPGRELDCLRVSGRLSSPRAATFSYERLGFALAAGGVGQRFFEAYYSGKDRGERAVLGIIGRALRYYAGSRLRRPLAAEVREFGERLFMPTRARVWIDGQELEHREHRALHAGAIDITLATALRVFPLAREPGVVHFQAGPITPGEMVRALPRLATARLIECANLVERPGRHMRIEPEEPMTIVVDGEMLGPFSELDVELGPRLRLAGFA